MRCSAKTGNPYFTRGKDMAIGHVGKIAKYVLSLSIFVFLSQFNGGHALAVDVSGTWNSNWGKMTLKQSGSEVTGTYATNNGKIFGTLNGNVLEGVWTQSSASRKCSTESYGSRYWGRIRFVFDQGGRFSGNWGYCNDEPKSGGWSGTRQ